MTTKREYTDLKLELGINPKKECSDTENKEYRELLKKDKPLPENVFRTYEDGSVEHATFYTVQESPLSKEELTEYIQLKQLENLITIKRCLVFFTVIAILSLVGGFIGLLSTLS